MSILEIAPPLSIAGKRVLRTKNNMTKLF